MPVTNVKSKWVAGNLVFYAEATGETILTVDKAGLMGLGDNDEQAPVLNAYTIADGATANADFELTHKSRIIDAWVVKVGAAGNAGANTIQIKNDDNDNITDAMNIRDAAAGAIVRAGVIDPTEHVIDPTDNELRITKTKAEAADNNACLVYVLTMRVA